MAILNKVKNSGLIYKFTALFMVMALIVAATGTFGISKISTVSGRVEDMLKARAAQEKMAVLMKVAMQECRVHLLEAALIPDEMDDFELYKGDYEAKRDQFRGYCDLLLKGNSKIGIDAARTGSVLQQRVKVVQEKWAGFEAAAEKTLSRKASLLQGIKPGTPARNVLTDKGLTEKESYAASDKVGVAIDDLLVSVGSLMTETKNEVSAIQRKAKIALITVIVSAIILAIMLGMVATRRIVLNPIMKMKEAAEKIASGELTCMLQFSGKDELASLGDAINVMAGNLKQMLLKIRDVTNSLSDVTTNIVSSSQNVLSVAGVQKTAIEETAGAIIEMNNSTLTVAKSAESLSGSAVNTSSAIMQMRQAIEKVAESSNVFDSSTQETASSIGQMIANIKQITESLEDLSLSSEGISSSVSEVNATIYEIDHHATESVGLSEKVVTEASEKGITAARAAMEGMEHIRKSVGALSDIINILGKRSEDIGNILTVIDEVTDQTTLLSLNAAILAAQAGEHGKAFAVVANEIKNFAKKTSVSTKEIGELITSVQEETRSSVKMAAGGIQAVEKGLRLVKDVNDALEGITKSSRVSMEMSKAIQRSTSEESLPIKQITDAVKGMSQQMENISLALQEQSKGSKSIIEQTEKMKEISYHVKTAIGEQRDGSKLIAGGIENVTKQAEQIAGATGLQKAKSSEMVETMSKIQSTTGKLVLSSNELNTVINALKEEAHNLLGELHKFKI